MFTHKISHVLNSSAPSEFMFKNLSQVFSFFLTVICCSLNEVQIQSAQAQKKWPAFTIKTKFFPFISVFPLI